MYDSKYSYIILNMVFLWQRRINQMDSADIIKLLEMIKLIQIQLGGIAGLLLLILCTLRYNKK